MPPWAAKKGEVSAGLEARGSTVSGGQRGDDQELEQCLNDFGISPTSANPEPALDIAVELSRLIQNIKSRGDKTIQEK